MGDPKAAPEEIVILQPEPAGAAGAAGPARIDLGPAAFASRMEIEVDVASQGLAPLSRAAETLLRQGKRFIVLDLSRFATLKGDEMKALVDARERCVRAHGALVLAGVQKDVAQALKTLALEKNLESASDEKSALASVRGQIEARRARESRVGDLQLDVHVVPLGKKKGDESFVEGYRRKGPEGVSRELVVLELDEKGVPKVAEKVRQLGDKKLGAFVLDLAQVATLDGNSVKEIVRAKKLVEERGGYLTLAGAKEAVAGLLKVMNLEREIPSHASREKAVEDFKEYLLDQIEGAESKRKPRTTPEMPAAAAPPPASTPAPAPAPAAAAPPAPAKVQEVAGAASGAKLSFERGPNEYVFFEKGKRPAKKDMAGDTLLLSLGLSAGTVAALPGEVKRAIGAGTNRIVVDMSAVGKLDPSALEHLRAASAAAKEKKARLVFAGIPAETAKSLADLEKFPDETSAAEQLAVEVLESKQKKGVKFNRVRAEVEVKGDAGAAARKSGERKISDDAQRPKTQITAVPTFDDEEERKPAKTAMVATPNFDDEKEERRPGKTAMVATPNFDDDEKEERKPGKTGIIATPVFDDDEKEERKPGKTGIIATPVFDDEERKPTRTAMIATPNFDDDEKEERKPGKTGILATPVFDDEEEERKPQKTGIIAAPVFDDEEKEERKPGKTQMVATPNFDDEKEERRPGKTQMVAAPNFDEERESKLPKVEVKGAAKPPEQKAPEPPKPAEPKPPEQKREEMRSMKTEMLPGLSKEEALKLAQAAIAPPKPAAPPPAPKTGEMRAAKTEMMPGLSKEEALKLAKAAVAAEPPAPAAPAKADDLKSKRTEMIATPPAAEAPKPSPKSGEMKAAKTEMMPGLSKEEALKLAKAAVAAEPPAPAAPAKADDLKSKRTEMIATPPAAEAPKPSPKSGEMKAAKTEMMPGLSKEEALKLAKAAVAGEAPPATKTGEMKAAKTEMIASPPPESPKPSTKSGEMKVAKTEVLPGLSKEEALRIAREAVGAPTPAAAAPAAGPSMKSAEMKVAKTEHMPGLSKDEALRIARSATGTTPPAEAKKPDGPPPVSRTVVMAAPTDDFKKTGSKVALKKTGEVAAAKPDEQTRKTGEVPTSKGDAQTRKTGEVAAAKVDAQTLRTEHMPGLSKAEAEAQLKAEAAPRPKPQDFQTAKTQHLDGMTKEDAKKIATPPPRPPAPPAAIPKELDAELKRSPLPLILGGVGVALVAVLLFWKPWSGAAPTPPKQPPVANATTGGATTGGAATTGGKQTIDSAKVENAAKRLQAAALDAIEMEDAPPAGR